jgi:hypothetical protein
MADVRCKVKLGDGSVMGPMDGPTLQTWYHQGLIDDNTPTLGPNARTWVPLSEVIDVRAWKDRSDTLNKVVPGEPQPTRRRPAREVDEDDDDDGDYTPGVPGRWRTVVSSLLLIAAAVGAGYLALQPQLWTPSLAGAPWMEIGLGLLALGLLLLPGWNWGRMLVRLVAVLGAVAALALMGPVMAQGADKLALLILACVWILAFALSVFLSPSLSGLASFVTLLVILAAAGAIGYLGYVPPGMSAPPPAAVASPAPAPSP